MSVSLPAAGSTAYKPFNSSETASAWRLRDRARAWKDRVKQNMGDRFSRVADKAEERVIKLGERILEKAEKLGPEEGATAKTFIQRQAEKILGMEPKKIANRVLLLATIPVILSAIGLGVVIKKKREH